MRRIFAWIGVLALVGVIVAAIAGPQKRREACIAVGLCEDVDSMMGAMLVSVKRQQALIVLTARLVAPITSARETTIGPVTLATTRQTAILPATVNYAIDLSTMGEDDLDWNVATRTLRVKRPRVTVMDPTIDWGKAQIYEDAGWATVLTDVGQNLRRDNDAKAPAEFRKQASAAELLAMANGAADAALETIFRMPLAAAGFQDARVNVIRSGEGEVGQ